MRSARAFSLMEMLVALVVTMVFMSAVVATFAQVSKGHKYAEARMDALRNGRSALATMSEEIKATNRLFVGTNVPPLNVGDGIDNDGDGAVDEELVNGLLDSAPSTATLDQHATLDTLVSRRERPMRVGLPDLGDSQVDVDAVFGRDMLQIMIQTTVPTAGVDRKRITYTVTQFEGEDNVLVRQVELFPTGLNDPSEVNIAPLAFKVVGLDLLYWNPNETPDNQTWVEDWDSTLAANFPDPKLDYPAAVYIRLSIIADPRPASALTLGRPLDVIPLETIVDLETIIGAGNFPRPGF